MSFPVPKAHPTEVMFTVVALHMITASILLNANVAFGALYKIMKDKLVAHSSKIILRALEFVVL